MADTTSLFQEWLLAILSGTDENTGIPSPWDDQQPMMHKSNKLTLSPGYRFRPKDRELAGYYLYKKLTNSSFTATEELLVNECDLYGSEEPWQVWERFGGSSLSDTGDDLYFFTRLKKKSRNGSHYDRRVGATGNWHGEDKGLKIKVVINSGGVIEEKCAIKKRFNYRNPSSVHHCRWIMHEYSLPEIGTSWVLCRLKKNDSTPAIENKKKRKAPDSSSNLPEANRSKFPAMETEKQRKAHEANNYSRPATDHVPQQKSVFRADNGGAVDYIQNKNLC